MRLSLFACAGLVLAGCATTGTTTGGSTAATPAQTVYQIGNLYAEAKALATAYAALPPCPTAPAGAACSDPSVVANIAKAESVLDPALATAEAAVQVQGGNPAAAVTALEDAFVTYAAATAVIPKKS